MTYVKVDGQMLEAAIEGRISNRDWDGRESKAITLPGDYAAVSALFSDGTTWSIVEEHTIANVTQDETGQATEVQETITQEYDNSAFSVLGDIVVHTDGTCTVYMGKETSEETLLVLLYGGDE